MQIQNYQSYQNNQPRFKANMLFTFEALGDVLEKGLEINKFVADKAKNGAEACDVVGVSRGYFAPDPNTPAGFVMKEQRTKLSNVENISTSALRRVLRAFNTTAETVSKHESTVVVNSL